VTTCFTYNPEVLTNKAFPGLRSGSGINTSYR
jgi:hypothetical protein